MTPQDIKISLMLTGIYMSRLFGLFLLFPTFSSLATGYQDTTTLKIGIALGAYSLAQALLQIPIGFLSDKLGRKKVLIVGLSLFLVGSFIALFATHINTLILGRIIQGAGAVSAVCLAYIGDTISTKNQPKTMAFIGSGIGLSFILSFIISPLISQTWGIKGIFLLITLLAGLSLLLGFLLPNNQSDQKQFNAQEFWKAIKQPKLLSIHWQIALLHLVLTASFFVIPKFIGNNLSDNTLIYWYLPPIIIAFIAVFPLIREPKNNLKMGIIQWYVMSIVLLAFTLLPVFSYQWLFIICLGVFFFAFTYLESTLPSQLFQLAPNTSRGTNSGIFSVHQFTGSFLGGVIGAGIYTISDPSDTINYAFLVLAGISCFSILLSQYIFKQVVDNNGK